MSLRKLRVLFELDSGHECISIVGLPASYYKDKKKTLSTIKFCDTQK